MKEKILLILLLLCFLWALFLGASHCLAAEPQNAVQIPTGQFTELQSNNKQLLLKLIELENSLVTLENHSEKLNEQLEIARAQLLKSQQALADANSSLTNAKSLQKKTKESLQSLEAQLELEREERKDQVNKLKWQRNLYAVLACVFLAK